MKKYRLAAGLLSFLTIMSTPALAAEWKQTGGAWRYVEEDGTFPYSEWKWIDGNQDGTAECYYFDGNGYLLTSTTTPDGCTVNGDGAWTVGGIVQTKAAESPATDLAADYSQLDIYGGDLSAKVHDGIEFSMENLGVSGMALGSIINPAANGATARKILEYKKLYNTGTDDFWLTAEQKAASDAFVASWKAKNITSGMSEEQIARKIYDYLTTTITYDKSAPNNQSSYGALIDKRCVCAGFAHGYHRLGTACGLEVRFLYKPNHVFNLVKISGKWYTVDATAKQYKTASTTAVYYMPVTPENDKSIEEKVEAINETNSTRTERVSGENAGYQEAADEAMARGYVFHISDANLIQELVDCFCGQVDPSSKVVQQKTYAVVYMDGKTYSEYSKLQFTYNGKTDSLHHIVAGEIQSSTIGGYEIKDDNRTACNPRPFRETSEDGMRTFSRLWTDENGETFMLYQAHISLDR